MFGRKKAEIRRHVEGYKEGRRLMRFGDGADEWVCMSIAKEHLLALVDMGRDTEGRKASEEQIQEILKVHGLRSAS